MGDKINLGMFFIGPGMEYIGVQVYNCGNFWRWRKVNKEIERKVRKIVRQILKRGDRVVSGALYLIDFYSFFSL